jgi:hypothetical protein
MITMRSVVSSLGPGRSGLQAVIKVAILLLTASTTHAETYDSIPAPYCKILFDRPQDYNLLESQVTGSNPKGTLLAQFVLEAFAQANANNAMLDSQSRDAVLTALNRLQAMWVPPALNFKTNYTDSAVSDDSQYCKSFLNRLASDYV